MFSKEFSFEAATSWRNYLTRNGAKKVYWRHQDPENKDYDRVGDICPMKELLCQGKFRKIDFIFLIRLFF